ncbi:hypothetical protein CYMTET_33873 [Cymbomonas tetramitiformis]|uniref:Uncharacterized protein n=1 Tax=Cymbomonas tetramitiformis TaxID=36881 RepID=A0AAE0FCA7_9CHLO|nr:hypothetical protein CYMTET_33873 [Cymbomonas tetramitiformis]
MPMPMHVYTTCQALRMRITPDMLKQKSRAIACLHQWNGTVLGMIAAKGSLEDGDQVLGPAAGGGQKDVPLSDISDPFSVQNRVNRNKSAPIQRAKVVMPREIQLPFSAKLRSQHIEGASAGQREASSGQSLMGYSRRLQRYNFIHLRADPSGGPGDLSMLPSTLGFRRPGINKIANAELFGLGTKSLVPRSRAVVSTLNGTTAHLPAGTAHTPDHGHHRSLRGHLLQKANGHMMHSKIVEPLFVDSDLMRGPELFHDIDS